jgi:hypothetical protein
MIVDEHDLTAGNLNAKKKASKVGKSHTTGGGLKLGKFTM